MICSKWVTQERGLGKGAWLRSSRVPCLEGEASSGAPVDHMAPPAPSLAPPSVLLSDP